MILQIDAIVIFMIYDKLSPFGKPVDNATKHFQFPNQFKFKYSTQVCSD